MHYKSERLRKLEHELSNLQQWLELDLVPKKDLDKHKGEIAAVQRRISEEKRRIESAREQGDGEDVATAKRSSAPRYPFREGVTLFSGDDPDSVHFASPALSFDPKAHPSVSPQEAFADKHSAASLTMVDNEESDPFSDQNRWRRGILEHAGRSEW